MEGLQKEEMIYYSIGFVHDSKLMDEFEDYTPNLIQYISN
jgi:hypothetical protein